MRLIVLAALGVALALSEAGVAAALERTVFNVYFDWGSTALDAKALEVVRKAAPKAKSCEYNGVRIVGHADRSHSEDESAQLGIARAKAVRDALTKLGLADSALSPQTKGELEPAKATADGVREPLNRRVEIIVVCD